METSLSSEEVEILKLILSKLVIKNRTGELGILYGLDRFISTQICLKKKDREILNTLIKKAGIINEVKTI